MRRIICFKMSRASLKGARKSKRTDNTEQASTSASLTPMWRPAICVSSEAVATVRVVKQSRNQLHTGRATLRNTRHKPMSSEGAPLRRPQLLSLPLLHQDKLSSWSRLRPCQAHQAYASYELASTRARQHLAPAGTAMACTTGWDAFEWREQRSTKKGWISPRREENLCRLGRGVGK